MTKVAEIEQEVPSLTLRAIQNAKNPGASNIRNQPVYKKLGLQRAKN